MSIDSRASTSQPSPIEKKKILVVNDESDMTTMLKMTLEREGFTVDTFNDPTQALKSYKPRLYDLIMLDVIMPKMDGFDLYTQLKKTDPEVNICFLTASSEVYREELMKGKYDELSRDLFLEMPLQPAELVDEIKKRISSVQ